MHATRGSVPVTILIVGVILFVVPILSGISYEQFGRACDRDRFPQIGRSVDIGGRSLNLFCSGEGRPAVIFETRAPWVSSNPQDIWEKGMPRPGYSWVSIQRETAKFTRACWYDRAGAGWSDLGPYPRSSSSQARDLHALLQAAPVPAPYVLVAESSAALDARVYMGFYPSEVAGLVFVDGVHPIFSAIAGRSAEDSNESRSSSATPRTPVPHCSICSESTASCQRIRRRRRRPKE